MALPERSTDSQTLLRQAGCDDGLPHGLERSSAMHGDLLSNTAELLNANRN